MPLSLLQAGAVLPCALRRLLLPATRPCQIWIKVRNTTELRMVSGRILLETSRAVILLSRHHVRIISCCCGR
eukprot:scaffold90603_cov43-Prasinocladus_malaysianus.AAC.1